jgi:hypothetical protein
MVKAISLRDYYNRREAFSDPDPLIRIAAIHHAGGKLDRNPWLRQKLKDLMQDGNPLIARYATITLIQSGDVEALSQLIHAISQTRGQEREELEACLRNCTRFPFALLLNERLYVETIPAVSDEGYREVLKEALVLTGDKFYEKSQEDPSFRELFLKVLRSLDGVQGLRVRDGSVLELGWVLSAPMGKQPGFLYCPNQSLFLKFREESVLNQGFVARGRQALFVAQKTAGIEVDSLYLLEDVTPQLPSLTPEVVTTFSRAGLLPGVVVAKWDSPDRVDVLCANGKSFQERYRAQKASVSQFVLIEEETDMGRSQCHFVPGVRLDPGAIRRIVSDYAAFNNLVLAQVTTIHHATHPKTGYPRCTVRTEKGEDVTTYIPAPRERFSVLMKACHVCQAAGEVVCDACEGRGENPCYGTYSCPRCKGHGTLDDGRECFLCSRTGSLGGCQGNGQIDCPVCEGDGSLQCDNCHGSGEYQPRRTCPKCHGSGDFSVTCRKCGGSGDFTVTCRKCGGSGSARGGSCWSCGGSGRKTLDCGSCGGTGSKTLECTACGGQGYWEAKPCNACDGQGSRECFYCHGDAQIQCPICHGAGKLSCSKCQSVGQIRCPYCRGNRLVFHCKVDCLRP